MLAQLLREPDWSVSRLASEVNREVGRGYISRTTASEWVNISRVPRQPLPTVIAHVLSQASGDTVRACDLWPGVGAAVGWLPADHGMQVPWNVQGIRTLARDWSMNGGTVFDADRRSFMAISGGALTAPAWLYADAVGGKNSSRELSSILTPGGAGSKIPAGITGMLKSTVDHLRRIDDMEGGGRQVLGLVHGEFRKVANYVNSGTFANSTVASQVLGVFGELAQLAGWVAYDSERHGLAQRYFRTGLQAAQSSGDRDLGAHILGWMACHAAYCGHKNEATEIAKLAVNVAQNAHPVTRSLMHVRMGYAQAAAGNLHGFRDSFEAARHCWHDLSGTEDGPSFLYWYGDTYIDILCGEGLQMLAFSSKTKPHQILEEADSLLKKKIVENAESMPRDSLFHSVWLARSQVLRGEIEQATSTTRRVMKGLQSVDSPRTIATLRRLDADLAARRSVDDLRDVKELRRELRPLLAT